MGRDDNKDPAAPLTIGIVRHVDETPREDKDEPLNGSNQELLRQSWMLLLRRPFVSSCYYSCSGIVGASLVGPYGGFLFQSTLYLESVFLLGPMGAATGLLAAARELTIDSGLAARVGREVYRKAAAVASAASSAVDDETAEKSPPPRNLKQAMEELRASYPKAESLIKGEGLLGYIAQTVLGIFLPNIGQVLDQIEQAIVWSDHHETELADQEVVARATTGYLEAYLRDKEQLVASAGSLLFAAISGVSLTVSLGLGSMFG